jgi:hypothetical protein
MFFDSNRKKHNYFRLQPEIVIKSLMLMIIKAFLLIK